MSNESLMIQIWQMRLPDYQHLNGVATYKVSLEKLLCDRYVTVM